MTDDNCLNFRKAADAGEGAAAFHQHLESCDGCRQWHRQNEEMLAMVSSIPQFDVPESLTQSVMQAVAAQPKRQAMTLLTPVAVVGVAGLLTLTPIDSLEGLLSSVVSMLGLYMVYLLVKSAPTEEMVG